MKKFFQRKDVNMYLSIFFNISLALILFFIVCLPPDGVVVNKYTTESYTFYLFFILMAFVSAYIARSIISVFDLLAYYWKRRKVNMTGENN